MAQGSSARKPSGLQVAYLRKQVAYNSNFDSNRRLVVGVIPKRSQVLFTSVGIKTGFSAAGTRVLSVGTNGTTANNFVNASDTITEETANGYVFPRGARVAITQDVTVYAKLTTAGTAASAGLAEVVVAFVPPQQEDIA